MILDRTLYGALALRHLIVGDITTLNGVVAMVLVCHENLVKTGYNSVIIVLQSRYQVFYE